MTYVNPKSQFGSFLQKARHGPNFQDKVMDIVIRISYGNFFSRAKINKNLDTIASNTKGRYKFRRALINVF